MTVINAKIFTMNSSDKIIENGFVRVKNGKITEVGDMSDFDKAADTLYKPLPDNVRDEKTAFVHSATENEEEIIDAKGAFLYPGFIDAHSHLGMWEDSIDFEGADGNEESDPCTPQMRAIDGVNPYDRAFDEALAADSVFENLVGRIIPFFGFLLILFTYYYLAFYITRGDKIIHALPPKLNFKPVINALLEFAYAVEFPAPIIVNFAAHINTPCIAFKFRRSV